MSRNVPDEGRARMDRVVSDHNTLRRETAELMVLAEHLGTIDPHARQNVVRRVTKVCDCLQEHFSLEEKGGYLVEVVERQPALRERVEGLQHQHHAFLEDGAALTRDLLSGQPPRNVGARIVALLEALHRHEQAEHELIQQALFEDAERDG